MVKYQEWEYRVVEMELFFDIMIQLGNEGFQLVGVNNSAVFLQRPKSLVSITPATSFSYETVQDGYVIFRNSDNKKIEIDPWELVNFLNE